MKKFTLTLFVTLLLGIQALLAQDIRVTGTVSDANGNPIAGVTVIVEGTTRGTTTLTNGNYVISAPANGTLQFTFVGMTPVIIPVQNRTSIDVRMETDAQDIDEVVVVAYGTARRSSLTGSVATVSPEDLEKVAVTSFEKALQGLSPGIQVSSISGQPGSGTQVRIRGVGSLTASSQPLYVIDGVAIETKNISEVANEAAHGTSANPLALINPSDIESISILKDASASALYGSRAANGVIVITTKRGQRGDARVTYRGQVSVSQMPSNGYDLMSGEEHYKLYYQGFLRQAINAGNSSEDAVRIANSSTQATYGRNPYNTAYPLDINGNPVGGAQLMIDTDWMGEIFRTGVAQEHDFGVSGGTDKSQYYFSLGYLNDEGITLGSDFTRYTGRINLTTEVKPWFSTGINSTFAKSVQNTPVGGAGGASPFMNAMYLPNLVPVYDLDDNFQKQYDSEGNVIYNYQNPIYPDMNAVALADTDKYETKTYRALVNPWVNFNLAKGLNWRTNLSYDYNNIDETKWYNPEHGNGAAAGGRLYKYAKWRIIETLTSTLNYNKTLWDDHNFDALFGYEALKKHENMTYAQGTNFPPGGLVELDMAGTPQETQSYTDKETMMSVFGHIKYNYLSKYYLDFTLRTDGSSRFAPGHRWGTFWSVGANWRISQENFMGAATWVDDLKIRASYGTSGNNEIAQLYGWQGLYSGGSKYNGQVGIQHSQLPNPTLAWEIADNINVGVDFSFWGRLRGSVDYYIKESDKLLLSQKIPTSSGLRAMATNRGGMRNSGIEVDLHSTNIIHKDFTWRTDFNIAFNKNKVTQYPVESEIDGSKIRQVGYSRYEFYIQDWAGVDPETGRPMWYRDARDDEGNRVEGEGREETTTDYNSADRYKVGQSLPKVTGGMTNTFSYKGIDFSFLITYGFGGKIYDGYMAYLLNDGNRAGYQAVVQQADSWTTDNRNASNPEFIPNNTSNSHQRSTRYLYDADFIKLRSINLGYTLPQRWLKAIQLNNVRVYASAENLLVWNKDSNFKGYDVELGGVTGVLDGGGTVPLPRTFVFGVNITF